MKTATITCHDVYNFGASLQAFALQQWQLQHGVDNIIIDYKPHDRQFKFDTVGNDRYNQPVIKWLYLAAKFPGRYRALKRKHAFDSFTSKYLHTTQQRYKNADEISQACPVCDVYIAGSDQIWNTILPNGRDRAFYLDFAPANTHRIAYAASFATDRLYNNSREFVQHMLKNFDDIAVRESSAQQILRDLGFDSSTLVCDPVFLLKRDQWDAIADFDIIPSKPYILVYDFDRSPLIKHVALELKAKNHLNIVNISPNGDGYADIKLPYIGPAQFISLIANAHTVVANSYHALAFSLIYHRDMFITCRTENNNSRMHDFMTYLSIGHRIVAPNASPDHTAVDFNRSDRLISHLITQSESFLKRNLSI